MSRHIIIKLLKVKVEKSCKPSEKNDSLPSKEQLGRPERRDTRFKLLGGKLSTRILHSMDIHIRNKGETKNLSGKENLNKVLQEVP